MNIWRALSKQLFGAKYERAANSIVTYLIVFFAIDITEVKIGIAPDILYLTATFFSAGIMWQTLHSSGNVDRMTGLFMLPFEGREMTFSIVAALTGYTLVTKVFIVLALFFAVHEWSTVQITTALLCTCNGCFMTAAMYTMTRQKGLLPLAVLWCAGVFLFIFFVQESVAFSMIVLVSLLLAFLRLLVVDAYLFYRPVPAKILIRCIERTGSIFLYLLRYLLTNRNYLLNTAGLCVIAGILPLMLGAFQGIHILPVGFAILCLNTPICTLLSGDPDLEQAVRVLPGQARRFCIRYCLFLFAVNMIVSSVYLISWQFQYGGIAGIEIITALLIALQSAILSVLLEWLHPIRNWKIENDLWHHPRKYIVPFMMMLTAGAIGIRPVCIWVLLCIVIAECFSMLFMTRR